MSDQAKELIVRFRNFNTRKAAMEELLLLGDEGVEDLVDALGHPMGSVQWCAQRVLTDLRTEAATARLVEALDDPRRQGRAAEALAEITGQTLGPDRQAWTAFLASGTAGAPPEAARVPEPAPAPAQAESATVSSGEPLSNVELVEAAIGGMDIDCTTRPGGVVLSVPLEEGRKQRVTISFDAKDFEGDPLVVLYTECGAAEAQNFKWALRQNMRMSFGAIAIRDIGDAPAFVMVNTHTRAAATPQDIRKSILLLARKGDALEKALTGGADER